MKACIFVQIPDTPYYPFENPRGGPPAAGPGGVVGAPGASATRVGIGRATCRRGGTGSAAASRLSRVPGRAVARARVAGYPRARVRRCETLVSTTDRKDVRKRTHTAEQSRCQHTDCHLHVPHVRMTVDGVTVCRSARSVGDRVRTGALEALVLVMPSPPQAAERSQG